MEQDLEGSFECAKERLTLEIEGMFATKMQDRGRGTEARAGPRGDKSSSEHRETQSRQRVCGPRAGRPWKRVVGGGCR